MISSAGTFLHFSWYDAQVRAMLFTKRASPNFVKEMKIKSEYSWETLWFISETNALCVPCRYSSNFYDRLVLCYVLSWLPTTCHADSSIDRYVHEPDKATDCSQGIPIFQNAQLHNIVKKDYKQSSLPSTIMRALMKIPLFAFQSLKHILIG